MDTDNGNESLVTDDMDIVITVDICQLMAIIKKNSRYEYKY